MGVQRWTGRESRSLRLAMRLSMRAFAEQLGVEQRTVSRWEQRGTSTGLQPASQALLDTMLHRADADAQDRFATLLTVGVADDLNMPAKGPQSALRDDAHIVPVAPTLLPLNDSSGDLEVLLLDAADESADWLSSAEASNVGELTVEELHSDVCRVAGAYLKAPTLPLFDRTRALRDRAFTLLTGRQRPSQARDLYAAAGWSLTLLAWMTVDLGRPDIAESHARTARACADNADHDGLRAWVCATQHTAAFWQDDPHRAAKYAAEGLRYATGSAAMFLASAYALDLARTGQLDAAREALVAAKQAAETPGGAAGTDEMAGPLRCSTERASGFWADTHIALGEAQPALDIADSGMRAFEATPTESRNRGSERMVRLQATRAHLVLGEYDGAAEALAPVLQTAPEHRVRPLLRVINDVRELATEPRRAHAQITAGIRDEISEFVRHPATSG